MRRRVTEHIPAEDEQRQIKLGAGDCATSNSLSSCCSWCTASPTRACSAATPPRPSPPLSAGGYIGRSDAAEFDRCYRYLPAALNTGSSSSSCAAPTSCRSRKPAAVPGQSRPRTLLQRTAQTRRPRRDLAENQALRPRELHERIFYRPLLNTAASLSSEEARLSPEAAQGRLAALGYLDPVAPCGTSKR